MAVVIEALDGCIFDRPVHPFNLTVCSGMVGLCQTVFDPIGFADHVEAHGTRSGCIAITELLSELDAVIGQNGMDPARNDAQETFEQFLGCLSVGFPDQSCDSEFACPVDSNGEVQLTLSSLEFGNIDVKKADGIAFEALSFGLISLHVWTP